MTDLDLTIERDRLETVRRGAGVVVDHPAVFRITGSGALTCLQGLFTNDLDHPGDGSLTYGAMLTPKGMIVADSWVIRQADALTMIAPASGRDAVREIFQRALPPRLAKAADLTGDSAVAWVLGAHGFHTLMQSGIGAPEAAGRVVEHDGGAGPLVVALAPEAAPFAALLSGPGQAVEAAVRRLLVAGAFRGEERDLHASRILAGWPALGVEIDEKTLPQEVRYDEIGGVSYTKGCYTGQETVARVHFRGHTNRELRGLAWREPGAPSGRAVVVREKEVGTVRSTLTVDGRTLGLALVRREVEPGSQVVAGGRGAKVINLPFGGDELDD
ncbi:MAG: folate-binding protein YgfZ [Gemmatimonadales bacterium]|nr:folate-binding protein YgfZ [Gemmatimonadales bacterium]